LIGVKMEESLTRNENGDILLQSTAILVTTLEILDNSIPVEKSEYQIVLRPIKK
jgi:hypothetical protein